MIISLSLPSTPALILKFQQQQNYKIKVKQPNVQSNYKDKATHYVILLVDYVSDKAVFLKDGSEIKMYYSIRLNKMFNTISDGRCLHFYNNGIE